MTGAGPPRDDDLAAPDGPPTLVVGFGNPLMTDDGIGLAALERLRERWPPPAEVELLDGGTWGLFLLPRFEDATRILLLDAIDAGQEPGTVVELSGAAIPRAWSGGLSPHQVGVRDLVALATLRGTLPVDLVAMGIQPMRVRMGTALSDVAAAALDELVDRAIGRLEGWGHAAVPGPAGAACTS